MEKKKPLRIFKLTNEPYVIIKKKKIPIKLLNKSQLVELFKNNPYKRKPRQKMVKRKHVKQHFVQKVRKVIAKRQPRAPRTSAYSERLKTTIQNLESKIAQLEREKNEKISKEREEQVKKEIEVLNQIRENIKRQPLPLPPSEPKPPIEEMKYIDPQSGLPVSKEEQQEIENLSKQPKTTIRTPGQIPVDIETIRKTQKMIGELEETKHQQESKIQKNKQFDKYFDKLVANKSGIFSFVELQELGIIPEEIENDSTNVNKFGWKKFLNREGIPIPDTKKGVKAQEIKDKISQERRKWINANKNVIKTYWERKEGLGSATTLRGDSGLYDTEIEEIMDVFPGFYGCVDNSELFGMFKQIVNDKPKIFSFIYLYENYSKNTNHWVAVFVDTVLDTEINYYDSYGKKPPDSLKDKMKYLIEALGVDHYLDWKYNKDKYQGDSSPDCGIYSMYFLVQREFGIPFEKAGDYDDVKAKRARHILYELF